MFFSVAPSGFCEARTWLYGGRLFSDCAPQLGHLGGYPRTGLYSLSGAPSGLALVSCRGISGSSGWLKFNEGPSSSGHWRPSGLLLFFSHLDKLSQGGRNLQMGKPKWLLNPASGRSTERLACTWGTVYLSTPVPQRVSDLLFGSRGREVTDYWVTLRPSARHASSLILYSPLMNEY